MDHGVYVVGVGGISHSSQIIHIDHLIQMNCIKSNRLDKFNSSSISLRDIYRLFSESLAYFSSIQTYYQKIKVIDNEHS